jgi:hypothetical protein
LLHQPRVLAIVVCISAALSSSTVDVHGQPSKLGPEFRVNNPNANRQTHPDVAMHDDGRFVVVWASGSGQDGSAYGVFGRRLNAAGVPQAVEFQVNTFTTGSQNYPEMAMSASGAFIVVWHSAQDGSSNGVFAKRFDSSGTVLATEFQVNVHTSNAQASPDVAMDDDGNVIVVWEGEGATDTGIFGRRFDSTGAAQGAEFQVHTYTGAGSQIEARVAAAGNGDFVVVWDSSVQDGSVTGIFGQRFDSAGAAQGIEFQINTLTSGHQNLPALAVVDDGAFVVAWNGSYPINNAGVLAQRFDATGERAGVEFVVNEYTPLNQVFPSVAAAGDGSFVVVFMTPRDGNGYGIFARAFDSAGAGLGSDFQVNTYTSTSQVAPAIAMASDGDFVIAWMSPQPADTGDVFVQRGGTPPVLAPLDIDGDAEVGALTDGLLVLRHLFGFTGSTLTSGAVGAGCTVRCDAATIVAYLAGLGMTLDVDGDTELAALTDGLLFLRFAFGFTGSTLITGAVDNDNCTRCNADQIASYLQGLI